LAKSVGAEFGVILVISFWRNESTFVHVWPDWLEFDGSEGAEYFDLHPHIGFAVLVSWCPVKSLENPEIWNQKLP
jgi:hypothetical protein